MKVSRIAAFGLAALMTFASLSPAKAQGQDRALKLYFVHTGEKATITYKRNGRFDPAGLAKVNRFLRDWRRNENARMDPRLLDIVWQLYDRTDARDYIHVVSAYRSPATNAMLRGRSRNTGVAKQSQHMLGKAMDFYIPGVKLSTLRGLAMQMQAGGVGYYPTSGSPFVHVDVGSVRAWPRMQRQELARLFPNGRTLHLPTDGKPLPGYDVALADYKRRVGPQSIQLASSIGAAESGSDDDERNMPMPASPSKARGSLLTAMLPVPKGRPSAVFAAQMAETDAQMDDETDNGTAERDGRNDNRNGKRPGTPAFADLAALAVPAPSLRPVRTIVGGPGVSESNAATDPIVTASLGVIPTFRPSVGTGPSPLVTAAVSPAVSKAFNRIAADYGTVLKEPKSSIASLPLEPADLDAEEEFDGQEQLIAWAISPPGSAVGMLAPVPIDRALMDHTAGSAMLDRFSPEEQEATRPVREDMPLPAAVSRDFDRSRFWSDG
ncbi:MAG: DUF882 domain-containing protein [Neorhizobium sp.]|nr:DUF882 domain-containing protein [Neorhizobium sp.]